MSNAAIYQDKIIAQLQAISNQQMTKLLL